MCTRHICIYKRRRTRSQAMKLKSLAEWYDAAPKSAFEFPCDLSGTRQDTEYTA